MSLGLLMPIGARILIIGAYRVFIGQHLISWSSKKQYTSRTSTEAEFPNIASSVAEMTWIKALLLELGIG